MHIGRTAATIGLAIATVSAFAGCGEDSGYTNEPRPPASIVITASISEERVSVSPNAFGAGPISLIVTNQTSAAQRLTLETANRPGEGPGIRQETAPISPQDTATLRANVTPGRYTIHVGADSIVPARLRVGHERPSAQNDLLQP
jgi:hypothetical protein